eukprot:CAMPEP_0197523788 /NCGR_PEP_ID=MMETSP1318-20131121/8651_1 /TAXON_ID=552666 /ORGANISM="Partenskyella glossopodia, Strain RCC365" /LENGTH=436 /DNA_ID=CAMNT_0043076587 /DNA_START=48 /DNA_END=1358 /DNA_ORIENTATION=+
MSSEAPSEKGKASTPQKSSWFGWMRRKSSSTSDTNGPRPSPGSGSAANQFSASARPSALTTSSNQKQKRPRATTAAEKDEHKKKLSWFGWGGGGSDSKSKLKRGASGHDDNTPSGSGSNTNSSSHPKAKASPKVSQRPVFKEIRLDDLDLFEQRKEFEAEVELLKQRYENEIKMSGQGQAKVRINSPERHAAEIKLKITTLQSIIDDLVLYRKPPEDTEGNAYTFWLLDALRRTMMPSGGFISRRIYVPQIVWLQENGLVSRYHLKMNVCNQLLKHFIEIEADSIFHAQPKRLERLVSSFEILNKNLEAMHHTLAFQLGEIHEPKERKAKTKKRSGLASFGTAIAKGTAQFRSYALPTKLTPDESQAYIAVLTAIFDKSRFLKDLLTAHADNEELCAQLGRVLTFLRSVVCTFVLHDVRKLLKQYHNASSRAFTSR